MFIATHAVNEKVHNLEKERICFDMEMYVRKHTNGGQSTNDMVRWWCDVEGTKKTYGLTKIYALRFELTNIVTTPPKKHSVAYR